MEGKWMIEQEQVLGVSSVGTEHTLGANQGVCGILLHWESYRKRQRGKRMISDGTDELGAPSTSRYMERG